MSAQVVQVTVVQLANHDRRLPLPRHESEGAAGMDLRACLTERDRVKGIRLPPMGRALIPTGLALGIPPGCEGQVRPRSGLAARNGVTVLNSPGTIDSDYRGEICVLLINLGTETFVVDHGARIAQLVIAPHFRGDLRLVPELSETGRGEGGFGSTGQE